MTRPSRNSTRSSSSIRGPRKCSRPITASLRASSKKKQYEDALKLLIAVTRAPQAPAELRAKGMLLLARVNEAEGESEAAINNYIKIEAVFGNGVPALSAEGSGAARNSSKRRARPDSDARPPRPA